MDNDGDGLVDEDPWGDSNGDGILDDDGDCLSLAAEYQDSNGDGNPCGPGDLGVDEDFSEQQLTDLVNTREIYLVPIAAPIEAKIRPRRPENWSLCPITIASCNLGFKEFFFSKHQSQTGS